MLQMLLLTLLLMVSSCKLLMTENDDPFKCPEADEFSGGNGSASSPYLLCSPADLLELDEKLESVTSYDQYKDKHYQIIHDIDLSGVELSPIGLLDSPLSEGDDLMTVLGNTPSTQPFLGTLDGKNYKLKNLSFATDGTSFQSYIGLFHHLGSSATVKNLKFENPTIDLNRSAMFGLVTAFSEGAIQNIQVTGLKMNLEDSSMVAGVVAFMNNAAKLSDVTVAGKIKGKLDISYDVGNDELTASSNLVAGVVNFILATTSSTVASNLVNDASINVATAAGGIFNMAIGDISLSRLTNKGAISSKLVAYGVGGNLMNASVLGAGDIPPSASRLYNFGNVTVSGTVGDGSDVAGILAHLDGGTLTDSGNRGVIKNNHLIVGSSAGVIADFKSGSAERIYNSGNITLRGDQTESDGTTLAGYGDVAGLIGFMAGSSSSGEIILRDCYSTGSLTVGAGTNTPDAGALVADVWELNDNLTIENCYSVMTYHNVSTVRGAMLGNVDIRDAGTNSMAVTLQNLYYSDPGDGRTSHVFDPASQSQVTGAGGSVTESSINDLSGAQLRQQASYVGFDFTDVWKAPTSFSYPTFK